MAQISLSDLLYSMKTSYHNDENVKFLGVCLSNLNKTESQCFQDIWALYENKFKTGGYFVEFGATNGIVGSNTYILEKYYGWEGILAEPNSVWHDELISNRKCNIFKECVYTESGKELEFLNSKDPSLSTISGYGDDEHKSSRIGSQIIKVKTISLKDLLKFAPKDIDYLSIDTEGSEFDILSKFFSEDTKHVIKCITIEHNNIPSFRNKIHHLMVNNGYVRKFETISRWDDFYILKDF